MMNDVATVMHQMDRMIPGDAFPVKEEIHKNVGMYSRMIFIPEGTMLLGKEHDEWSLNIFASGTMLLLNDPLKPYVEVTAPQIFETGPGSQKLAKALTDCVFINIVDVDEDETTKDVVDRIVKGTKCQ